MDYSALENLSAEDLMSMDAEARNELTTALHQYWEKVRYNRIEYFKPFDYQKKFMKAGADYKLRFLRAANRIGKSYGAAAEFSYHLTGKYPEWWEGLRIQRGGLTYWCIGVTLDSVRKVLQKELIGTADCRIRHEVGTGAIPRDCIDLDSGWQPDGARLTECRIKHVDGSTNTLMFYSAETVLSLMGQSVAGIFLDEEPLKSIDLYSQCVTRLANSLGKNKDGFFMFTATPEVGQTPLNDLFESNEGGVFYLQSATWDDCPLISEKQKEEWLASYPEWQRLMRSRGIPVQGQGSVFQLNDSDIVVDDIEPFDHWQVIGAVDWGSINDPTVFIVSLYDPDNKKYYLYDEWYLGNKGDGDEYIRSPKHLAQLILNSQYRGIPIVVPADSGLASEAHETKGKILIREGVNVVGTFRNPNDSQMNSKYKSNATNKSTFLIEPGLEEMRYLFQNGQLKVHQRCTNWLSEKQNYYYKVNPLTGSRKYSGADHAIDASRYSLLSLICNRGCDWFDVDNLTNRDFQSFSTIQFNNN